MDIHTAVRSRICHIWNKSNDNGISEDVNFGPGCILKERRADSVHGKRFRVGTEPLIQSDKMLRHSNSDSSLQPDG